MRPGGGLGTAVRDLAASSAVYGLGSILTRGLAFLLLPVYTRFLTPADYGLVTITTTIVAVLALLYPLGLHGALGRFYFATESPEERRARSGTIWIATILAATGMTLLAEAVGPRLLPSLLPDVPFSPYGRLAIWTAFFATFSLGPLVMLQLQERPRAYVAVSLATTLVTAACILALVVGFRLGAIGYLWGGLLGAGFAAACYAGIAFRNMRLTLRRGVLVAALAYSLPLVPHALAGWVLELSDRAILARFVPLAEVGVYSLGYQIGTALGLVVAAFNSAWVPYLFKTFAAEGEAGDRRLARLATYFIMVVSFVGLGLALLVEPVVRVLFSPPYLPAASITPWVLGANVLYGLYLIPIGLLFWKEQTRRIPLVTFAAGLVNVGLNLWLVPRYGMIAAAWSTIAAYAVMALLAWYLAQRVRRFPYEYGRLARTLAAGGALYGLGGLLPSWGAVGITGRTALWLAFPLGLAALGTFESRELAALKASRWARASQG